MIVYCVLDTVTGAGDNSDEDVYNPSLLNGKVCRKIQRSKQAGAKQCGSNYDIESTGC